MDEVRLRKLPDNDGEWFEIVFNIPGHNTHTSGRCSEEEVCGFLAKARHPRSEVDEMFRRARGQSSVLRTREQPDSN